MKRGIYVLLLVVVIGALAILVNGLDRKDEPVYLMASIERGGVVSTTTATGTVKAVVTVDVGSQLSGQIDELYVDFNDEVEKGQALARIDPRSFVAKVREAEAALEAAKAGVTLREADAARADSRLASVQAQVGVRDAQTDRAAIGFKAANLDLDRIQELMRKGAAAQRQYDQARTDRDAAAAQLREAEAERQVHAEEIATAKADIRRAEAELQNARADFMQREAVLTQAQIELGRTVIRSPIKGVVIGRSIDMGQTVAASLEAPTLFKIAQNLSEMEVHARIDEADIGRIRVGQRAITRVDAFPGRHFKGTVTQIRRAPEVVKNVVTYTVVIATPNPDRYLLPGMTALVRIVIRESTDVLKVPNAALRFHPAEHSRATPEPQRNTDRQAAGTGGPSATLWVLNDAREPKPVRVQLGLTDGVMTEIAGGPVDEGLKIIVGLAPQDSKRGPFGLRFGF